MRMVGVWRRVVVAAAAATQVDDDVDVARRYLLLVDLIGGLQL